VRRSSDLGNDDRVAIPVQLSRCCRGQLQNLEPTNRLFCVCWRRLLTNLSCLAISCLAILVLRHFHVRHFQRPRYD